MTDKRIILNFEQAVDMLPQSDTIHCFKQVSGNCILGTDYTRDEVMLALKDAEILEIGGESCQELGHALVCIPKNAQKLSEILFFQTIKEKIEYYEKLLNMEEL